MGRFNGVASKEVGLSLGLLLGRHFLGVQDLHYGYWFDDLPVDIGHLRAAQAAYTELVLSRIPLGVKSVLDVGCGSGATASKLLALGYSVDCVSPNPSLTAMARKSLGGSVRFYETPFESLRTERRYDLLLFSESFQYIKAEVALPAAADLLDLGGFVLICDFFRLDMPGKCPIGGGQRLELYRRALSASPFECLSDQDITRRTAPTVQLVADLGRAVLEPGFRLADSFLSAKHPWLAWLLHRMFDRKIARTRFGADWTPEVFARHKTYRLILLRKRAAGAGAGTSPAPAVESIVPLGTGRSDLL